MTAQKIQSTRLGTKAIQVKDLEGKTKSLEVTADRDRKTPAMTISSTTEVQDLATDRIGRTAGIARRAAFLLGMFGACLGMFASQSAPASAATSRWYTVSAHGGASGSAIMNYFDVGRYSSHAGGRVQLNLTGQCGYIKYAPFADLAADGSYTKLRTYCGGGWVTLSWSDTFHLGYNGFKFQVCTSSGCGSERHIYG